MAFAFSFDMLHDDLLSVLQRNASFDDAEDAQRALGTTLETLGYLLPVSIVRELAAELPRSCTGFLELGLTASDGARRCAHAQGVCAPAELPGPMVEEIRKVCGALSTLLPSELVRRIDSALPRPLTGAFTHQSASSQSALSAVPELTRHVALHGRVATRTAR